MAIGTVRAPACPLESLFAMPSTTSTNSPERTPAREATGPAHRSRSPGPSAQPPSINQAAPCSV